MKMHRFITTSSVDALGSIAAAILSGGSVYYLFKKLGAAALTPAGYLSGVEVFQYVLESHDILPIGWVGFVSYIVLVIEALVPVLLLVSRTRDFGYLVIAIFVVSGGIYLWRASNGNGIDTCGCVGSLVPTTLAEVTLRVAIVLVLASIGLWTSVRARWRRMNT